VEEQMNDTNNPAGSETNRDRFVRVAERRVNRILDDIDSLSNCSNRKNYDYGRDDVQKIFSEIERKIRETRQLFELEVRERTKFTLE